MKSCKMRKAGKMQKPKKKKSDEAQRKRNAARWVTERRLVS